MKQQGQIILILILVMTVALAIGLSIVQKSLVDVSTSSKVEQSSRAFSAAEAGVEKALKGDASPQPFADNNSSISAIGNINLIPAVPNDGSQQIALEYPPLSKEDVAQVWLADFNNSTSNPPPAFYSQNSLDIYWGASGIDAANKPAIEVKVIYYAGGIYQSKPFYLDSNISRVASNGFTDASSSCTAPSITTTTGNNRQFYCKSTIDLTGLNPTLMLMRIRLLYSSISQPFAVQAKAPISCTVGCYLPPQAKSITSTGLSGETQRKVNLFQLYKVVPPYFDYAIFSAGEIKK